MRTPTANRHTVAAFDFDGTLIEGASMTLYLKHLYPRSTLLYRLGKLLPSFFAFSTKLRSRTSFKEEFLTDFLGGMKVEDLFAAGEAVVKHDIPPIIRPAGLRRISWHQAQGHRCILITASLTFWTQAFAQKYGLELIATQPEVVGGKFTGRLIGDNNYGPAKVKHLYEYVPSDEIAYLYAYGDTGGDRELLAQADEGYYRPFHPGGALTE